MVDVDLIENYYLREYAKKNTINKSINEMDYIKFALSLCVDRLCDSMLDLPNQLKQFDITIEQYLTKDNIIKYSYKTDRLEYAVSEDKLGSEFSNIALRNKLNNKKNNKKYKYKNNEIKKNKLLMELGLQLPLCTNNDLFIYDDSIINSLENVKKNGHFVLNLINNNNNNDTDLSVKEMKEKSIIDKNDIKNVIEIGDNENVKQ